MNRRGVRILVDPLDVIGHTICFEGAWEPLSLTLAERLMSKGGTFLDVGANFGLFSCCVAPTPGVKCIAVDASAVAFAKLLDNLKLNQNISVKAVNTALGAERSLVRLECHDATNLGMTKVVTGDVGSKEILHFTASMPLNELLSQLRSGPVELMKIDVEGYEFEVFRGLDFTGENRPKNIIMEYCERVTEKPGDLASCFRLLSEKGYKPFTVTGEEFDPSCPVPEENLWWR